MLILVALSVLGLCLLILDTLAMFGSPLPTTMYVFTFGVWGGVAFIIFGVLAMIVGFTELLV